MHFKPRDKVGYAKSTSPTEFAPDTAPGPMALASRMAQTDYTLVSQIGSELSVPVNAIREISQEFSRTRRLSHMDSLALMAAVESADQIARQSQQIARLAEGRLRQSHERLSLDGLLRDAVNELKPGLEAQGVTVRLAVRPVEVIVDAGLLSSLVEAALNWGCSRGQHLAISLQIKNWPENALLRIKARPASGQRMASGEENSLNWHLLTHIAKAMGVLLEQTLDATGESALQLEFSRTVRQHEGLTAMDIDGGGDAGFASSLQPMAGLRLLLVSSDPLVRAEVDATCRRMSVATDSVSSVDRAKRYLGLDTPHMIVIDARLRDEEFDDMVEQIRHADPNVAFLEITDDANTFEVSSWQGDSMARISREILRSQLSPVLTMELAKVI